MNLTRRQVLTAGASVAVGAFFGTGRAFATVEDVEAAIAEFAGGKEPAEGVLTLTTPEIAENGNSVPISVSVDSPMTDSDYVDSVIIFADGNPNPEVVTFNFSPVSGEAKASTRMRLAKTQNVVAVAKLSNGDVYKMSNNVKVTIGGCGG
ncbi:MAG: thiosulfate oxidation carrier protein SoxY [Gammaproteobacteria bacterium]|nr:thiosulfate oxidation carrier protein SoxY [Gammaproteobacteria bacterium]